MGLDSQAVKRVGPAPASQTAKINRAFRTPAAVDGSASWTIPGAGPQKPGCWVTISNIGTAAADLLAISFQGTGQDGGLINASSANDFVLPPGTTQDFWCDPGIDTIRHAGPVTAIASEYRSSL